MGSFQFVHAADLHINSPLRGLEADSDAPQTIRAATRDAFSTWWTWRCASSRLRADRRRFVRWRLAGLANRQFLIRESAKLAQAGIRMIGIRGNHDAESIITRRLPKETIQMFRADQPEQVRLAEFEVCIHGQSFATRDVTENLARNYPAPLPATSTLACCTRPPAAETDTPAMPRAASISLPRTATLLGARARASARGAVARPVLDRVFRQHARPPHRRNRPERRRLVTVQDGRVAAVEHRELDVVRWALLDTSTCPTRPISTPRWPACAAGWIPHWPTRRAPAGRSAGVERSVSGAHRPGARSRGDPRHAPSKPPRRRHRGDLAEGVQVRTGRRSTFRDARRSDAVGMLVREIAAPTPDRLWNR